VTVSVETLPRVGGTDAGSYRSIAPDVIVAVPHRGYVQSEVAARASLAEFERLAQVRGRRQVLLVLVDRVRSQDAGSRRVWQRELDKRFACGMVLVCESLLARAIGSFFIGLRRPVVPTQMVSTIEEALRWARERVEVDGGAIDIPAP
jgi:hypothetical protein